MFEVFRSERVIDSGVSCCVSKVAVEVEVATLTSPVGGGEGGRQQGGRRRRRREGDLTVTTLHSSSSRRQYIEALLLDIRIRKTKSCCSLAHSRSTMYSFTSSIRGKENIKERSKTRQNKRLPSLTPLDRVSHAVSRVIIANAEECCSAAAKLSLVGRRKEKKTPNTHWNFSPIHPSLIWLTCGS